MVARRHRSIVLLALASLIVACVASGSCSREKARTEEAPRAAAGVVDADSAEVTVESWTFEGRAGRLVRTPAYRVFTTLPNGRTLDRLPTFAEAALDNYTTALATLPRPSDPMETYVMSDRSQWERLTERTMGADAGVYLRIPRGGFTERGRAILWFIGPRDTLAIVAHEGWHQYTQSVFKDPLPVWLEEGIACYMEGFRWSQEEPSSPTFLAWSNVERFDALRAASNRGSLLSLESLLTSTPQDLMATSSDAALTYYAQAWALVHFLASGEGGKHRAALSLMLSDASTGKLVPTIARVRGSRAASSHAFRRRGPDALLAYVGSDLASLGRAYNEFVAGVVRVGNKQRIVQGFPPQLVP